MKPVPVDAALRSRAARRVPPLHTAALVLCLALAGPLACAPLEPEAEPSPQSTRSQALEMDNGLSANGLSANGLSANGLSQANFAAWFEQAPEQNAMLMKYLVRCAVPDGQFRTYTSAQTQQTYMWQGRLGLAPGWANGQPATLAEQQLVSACLAAHVNKFGVSVTISVLGKDAAGALIPFTFEELQHYSRKEACFFGNLFNGEGIYFGSDGPRLHAKESSSRACELSSEDLSTENLCPPLTYAGTCSQLCQPIIPGGFYVACTWNGITYRPLTTRVSPSEIYECGDHICQVSEQCSTGHGTGCEKDCGICPGH